MSDALAERQLADGTWLHVYPLLFSRARLVISSAASFALGSADDEW